jgi:putative DNA primase/helicase
MENLKKPFHETVADKLIEQLKEGTAPWQKPWQAGEPGAFMPTNPTTGKRYKGINAIQLMSQGHEDQRWMTYKQAAAVDAQVRKGEKGTPIQYWKFSEEHTKTDANGKPVLDAQGESVKQSVKLERPRVFFATVFNADQIDGLPPIQPRKAQEWSAVERAEQILQASGAVIRNGEQNRAFYRPATDSIHLPDKGQFATADSYYATALHELGHWTGHETRLDRDLVHPFGSDGYAKEELRAEIASMILGDELGIGHDPEQHAAYVGSWIKVLKDDPLEIFRAAADAEKIQNYVLGLEQKQIQEQAPVQTQIQSEHPAAFLDTNGMLRDWNTADRMPADWQGVVKNEGAFWHVGREAGERSFTVLGATTLQEAEAEAARVAALAVDIREVLSDPDVSFSHYEAFQGATLEDALRSRGLTTIGNVTGSDPVQLHQKASDRLSVVFGIALDHSDVDNPYLERKGLAQAFAVKAEQILMQLSTQLSTQLQQQEQTPEEPMQQPSIDDLPGRLADPLADDNGVDAVPATAAAPPARQETEKTLIDVPFKQKDEVKALGAKWDRREQSWYVPAGADLAPFAKWTQGAKAVAADAQPTPDAVQTEHQKPGQEREYLAVPYGDRALAKAAGAEWDKTAKSWYAGSKADMAQLERWKPENVPDQQGPAMTPQEEFADALRSAGCVVDGEHPIMDGEKHRISVEGEKHSEKAGSGFYVGHLDGHPAGYIKNNKTGIDMKWKAKGYTLEPEQKALMAAEAAAKLQARETEHNRLQEQAAKRVSRQSLDLVPVEQPTPYMQAKGITPQAGVLTDKEGLTTYIPATDAEGKQWTMQYIQEDGTKRFAKDSRKEGCFHVVGGMDALAKAPALVIGEGYATAGSLSQSLGFATVAAFDSGNLPLVAKVLHEKFPDKLVIIAGDDDKHLEATQGVNPGRAKAEEAAKAVGGKALFPIFAPGEQAANPRGFTDFNDLANKSVLGTDGIDRQVLCIVDKEIKQHQALARQQEEHVQKQEQRPRRVAKIG